ncbi:diuretic hormone class 2 [Folsomia candida]|uniref:Diuretic hormone class 2 n=1 Tax=Folsomia candida TaxID=158441 RepID=A0A226E6Q9_FOLCA|nr:diuretic hormone class 2 [Folsomia candida]OXA53293.1 Diuretic hormone class 2 [Folsomia candida]
MHKTSMWMIVGCISVMAFLRVAFAYPNYQPAPEGFRPMVEVEDPEAVLEMLARLGQSILRAKHDGSNAKRGLDLGLGRGFSGSQAAKHIMGLAAANFASGPGKRKRMEGALDYPVSSSGLDVPPLSGSEWYNKS